MERLPPRLGDVYRSAPTIMKRRELRQCMERLAEEHSFRWVEKSKRFLGIRRGIIVEVSEWDGEVAFRFSSPTVQVGDEILEDFAGFTHLADAGIPTNWIKGLIERDANGGEHVSDRACGLSIDTNRIDYIGVNSFTQIPDVVAEDFHAHGASQTLPCSKCGKREATIVGLLNSAYSPMCLDCWKDLQFQTSGGKLATEQSVNWLLVIPTLAVLTAVGGYIWGFLQQPQHIERLGFFAMLLPAVWAFGLCWAIRAVSGGVTRMLRLSLFASTIISVLAGNIWGFRSFAIQQIENEVNQPVIAPAWLESIQLYFVAFPNAWQGEIPFVVGGVLGAWFGLRLLKSEETIDVQ